MPGRSADFVEASGANICKDTISRIADTHLEEMQPRTSRPLRGVYAAIFVDPLHEVPVRARNSG